MNISKFRDIQAKMPSPKVIYASNESKSVLARNLEECRDNDKNSQSVFLSFKCILARNCEGTEQLQNNTEKTEYSGERGKHMSYAIAIDGPSGAGKSTIAKRVAKELSFIYVDTGAMYRAMALYVLEQNIDPQDQAKVAAVCPDIDVTILYEDGVQQVLLNGKNVSAEIRQEIVGNTASKISVIKEVREKLVALQRQLAADLCDTGSSTGDPCDISLLGGRCQYTVPADAGCRTGRSFNRDSTTVFSGKCTDDGAIYKRRTAGNVLSNYIPSATGWSQFHQYEKNCKNR